MVTIIEIYSVKPTTSVRFSVLNVSAMVSSVASVGSGVRVVLVPCGPGVA
jgi:hypothetical protein